MKYKHFGNTGLRVSELCLGTMTFGTAWGNRGCDKATSKQIFDAYAERGGNFLDTANRYTEGESEAYLGEFIAADRDHFVLATKYTLYDRRDDPNFMGNGKKNLVRSVEASLKRLDTDYIDLLWLHMWDFSTPVEEVMRALDDLVSAGKVLYTGISDTPAWIVAKANTYAEQRGLTPFAGLQVEYSLVERTVERDLLPMARHFGMAVTPWSPLGAGLLTGKYLDKIADDDRLSANSVKMTERNLDIARKVVQIAQEVERTPAQVAINWVRQQNRQVIPIIGAKKLHQAEDCFACVDFELSEAHLAALDEASAIDLGFPHEFFTRDGVVNVLFGDLKDEIDNHHVV